MTDDPIKEHTKELEDLCEQVVKEFKKDHDTTKARELLAPHVAIIDERLSEHHYVQR
jgi:hypothetical protein